MNYHCCEMDEYYLLNGVTFNSANAVTEASKCISKAPPSDGSYDGTTCETVGTTLHSGNSCKLTCSGGKVVNTQERTICISGTLYEAACIDPTSAPSAAPSSSPAPSGESETSVPSGVDGATGSPSAAPSGETEDLVPGGAAAGGNSVSFGVGLGAVCVAALAYFQSCT